VSRCAEGDQRGDRRRNSLLWLACPAGAVLTLFCPLQHLRRELSRRSSLHRTQTGSKDPEKEGSDSSEDFDLLEYLRGEADQYDAAGFKRKVVGVSWEKFNVKGSGGMKARRRLPRLTSPRRRTSTLTSLRLSRADLHPHLP